jgi:heptosyltransferase II
MNRQPFRTEPVSCSPWNSTRPPDRVLIIRMHAIGDVAITLPTVTAFRRNFPHAQIDFLTTTSCSSLLATLSLTNTAYSFPDRLRRWGRLLTALRFGWKLRSGEYDIVIDLQRNWVSRLIRRMVSPRSWAEFERFVPRTAGERVLDTFRSAGFPGISPVHSLPVKDHDTKRARQLLLSAGWSGTHQLVTLNPAGLWETRHWPLEKYLSLARLFLVEENVQFILLGTERMRERSRYLVQHLGHHVVDLVEQTTLGEALAALQFSAGMISEDSGLMHMAWASGIPVVALFGSTNHVMSAPVGNHVRCFHSGDLPCGACMEIRCRYNDNHCLTRVTSQSVFEAFRQIRRSESATVPKTESAENK